MTSSVAKPLAALSLALTLLAHPALAVRPDEMLPDPAQEARARALSQGLRCLVCRNESIDDSDADLAHDLRVLLRQRIAAGDSDQAAVDYIVARYGEFVLLNPPARGVNLILWLSGPAALVLGAGLAFVALRRRARQGDAAEALSPQEEARLKDLL